MTRPDVEERHALSAKPSLPVTAFLAASQLSDFDGRERRYVLRKSFCYWQDRTRANGTFLWGKPSERDIAEMEPFWSCCVGKPHFDGRAVFIDARDVEAVDALGFKRLLSYLISMREALGGVGSTTMVHGGGMVGVVTAGILNVVAPSYPVRAVGAPQLREAFGHAGVPDLYDDVEALRLRLGYAPEIVLSVRSVLQRLPDATIDDIADALGLSARTLQRRLDSAGTTLRQERQAHVMRRAEELLAATTLDLEAVAGQLGLSSASHLVTYFRRVHGTTPGEWRERNRR